MQKKISLEQKLRLEKVKKAFGKESLSGKFAQLVVQVKPQIFFDGKL